MSTPRDGLARSVQVGPAFKEVVAELREGFGPALEEAGEVQ